MKKGFTLVELLVVVAILALLATLIVPAVGFAMFHANRATCKTNCAAIAKAVSLLAVHPDNPTNGSWPVGTVGATNADKCRNAFWKLMTDPKIVATGITTGGWSAFHCPGGSGDKEQPDEADGDFGTDNVEVKKRLYYSFANQMVWVPSWGAAPSFVVFGDRSPQDDYEAFSELLNLHGNSYNHRWGSTNMGQNIAYATGNVVWVETTTVGVSSDEIYNTVANAATPGTVLGADATCVAAVPSEADKNDTCLMPVTLGLAAPP